MYGRTSRDLFDVPRRCLSQPTQAGRTVCGFLRASCAANHSFRRQSSFCQSVSDRREIYRGAKSYREDDSIAERFLLKIRREILE